MYETADMNSPSKRSIVAQLIRETRAEVPEWTRDRIRDSGQRTAHPATTAEPKAPAVVPVITKRADELTEKFRKIARDCESDIKKLQDKVRQIDQDICALSMYGMKGENYDAILKLKAEKDDLLKRIEKLRLARKIALKEAAA